MRLYSLIFAIFVSLTLFTQIIAQGTYTVKAGDTLTSIASSCGTTVGALQTANPSISDPNLIFAGQVITLPAGAMCK